MGFVERGAWGESQEDITHTFSFRNSPYERSEPQSGQEALENHKAA